MNTESLPRVPISEFKANPARYLPTGAVVTNHGKERATFLPIDTADSRRVDAVKATLRLLYRVQSGADTATELAELSAARDQDLVDEPR